MERMSSLVVLAIAVACGPQVAVDSEAGTEAGTDGGTSGADGSSPGNPSTSSSAGQDDMPGSPVTSDAMPTSDAMSSGDDAVSTGDAATSTGEDAMPTSTEDTAPSDTSDDGPVGCEPPCVPGQECIAGICFGDPDTEGEMCPAWADDGNYAECLVAGGEACDGGVCVMDNPVDPTASACALLGCTDVCDCPDPGDLAGTLVCDMVTQKENGCFFTCEDGQACPEGMMCLGGVFCSWPAG